MATEGVSGRPGRPRPWLLIALALVAGVALISWVMPGKSAAPPARASNPRPQPGKRGTQAIDPADLDVRLEDLKAARPGSAASERNPFRFYVKPPPAPAPDRGAEGRKPPPPPSAGGAATAAASAEDPVEVHRVHRRTRRRESGSVQRLPHDHARSRGRDHRGAVSARPHRRRVSGDGVCRRTRTGDNSHDRTGMRR
jgi:hypothetical protein